MKKPRFTKEQIVFALKLAELSTSVPDAFRRLGISHATLYNRRKKYGGTSPFELRHMRQLEEENLRPMIVLLACVSWKSRKPAFIILTGGLISS